MISELNDKSCRPQFPFNAIVGQDTAKKALILNAIDPSIGGVLISGPKGTGKSLLSNAFSEILPSIKSVEGCPFNCNPNDPTNMCSRCRDKLSHGSGLQIEKKSMKFVKVPLSVTEDMIVGSIDVDKAVTKGVKALRPGLMAEANQGILYIDEVNLLPDHITDSILDAAASGWNTVEREGISVSHPSRFILVGTMNPEEGELRPQILDRFGLYAETESLQEAGLRRQVLERNEEFRRDPYKFISNYRNELSELKDKIEKAKELLPEVSVPIELYKLVAETCTNLKVDGFRPDIVAIKTARALAAYNGRDQIEKEDIQESLELTLGHRTRSSGLSPPPEKREIRQALRKSEKSQRINLDINIPELGGILLLPGKMIGEFLKKSLKALAVRVAILVTLVISFTYIIDTIRISLSKNPISYPYLPLEIALAIIVTYILTTQIGKKGEKEELNLGLLDHSAMRIEASGRLSESGVEGGKGSGRGMESEVTYTGEDAVTPRFGSKILGEMDPLKKRPKPNISESSERARAGGGYSSSRRTKVITSSNRGRSAWYRIPENSPKDVAIVPTIKAAALRQGGEKHGSIQTVIKPEDIRENVREYSAPYSIILLIDMSLSMVESVDNIVNTIYSLHRDVYRRRDRVGLIVFKGSKAYTIQHPTRNLDLVVKKLRDVGASDFTPMAAGLFQAWKALRQEKIRNKDSILHLYIISDGITNVPLETPLSPLTRRRYTNEAQADAIDVAHLLSKENIKIKIFNTDHSDGEAKNVAFTDEKRRKSLTPTQFLMELAKSSKGEYIGLKTIKNNV